MATRDDYQDPYDQPYPTQTQPTAPAAPPTNTAAPGTPGGPIATNPDGSQVGAGIPWSTGPDAHPLYAPPGYHWDPQYAAFMVGDAPGQAHDDPGAAQPAAPPPTTAPPPTNTGGPAPPPSPSVTPPLPTPPPAFHYDDFTAPDPNDLSSDPAFQFENAQGMQAIGARNAALGTLNTGGTLKDYVTFGQNLAHTRYADLFNQRLTQYGTNRGNALDNYNTNYNTQYKDPWSESMQRASLDQNNNQFNSSQGFNAWLENYKRSVLDPFDEKYKTLSLL